MGRRPRWGAAVLVGILLGAGLARAQTVPPAMPGTAAADAGAPLPDAQAPAPDAQAPAAPPAPDQAPAATPPPGATAPVPTLTPEPPAALPALTLDQGPPPRPGNVPFYRKDWFWGGVGVLVLTAVILLFSAGSSNPATPSTTLGDMRAF